MGTATAVEAHLHRVALVYETVWSARVFRKNMSLFAERGTPCLGLENGHFSKDCSKESDGFERIEKSGFQTRRKAPPSWVSKMATLVKIVVKESCFNDQLFFYCVVAQEFLLGKKIQTKDTNLWQPNKNNIFWLGHQSSQTDEK